MEFCLVYVRSPLIADTLGLPPPRNYPVPFLVDFKHRCSPDILFYLSFTLCKNKRLTLNIVLEKFSQQDFADYFKLVSNAQVMAMITERAVPHDEARRDYDQLLKDNAESAELGHFRISDAQDGHFIGLGKLLPLADPPGTAELGYMLLPDYWGKGIASQVAAWLMDRAHHATALTHLIAIIDPANLASRKILINHHFTSQEFREFDGLPGEILARAL